MALDGSPRFTGEVELKQRRSRDAPFLVCEDSGCEAGGLALVQVCGGGG
jgi:hypothetical protein